MFAVRRILAGARLAGRVADSGDETDRERTAAIDERGLRAVPPPHLLLCRVIFSTT